MAPQSPPSVEEGGRRHEGLSKRAADVPETVSSPHGALSALGLLHGFWGERLGRRVTRLIFLLSE